jgi:hypothetical protein
LALPPAEIALALGALAGSLGDPSLATDVAAAATDLVRGDLLANRIQLWTPLGYWRDHVGLPCLDAAPVFAVRPGPPTSDPVWTLRRP